MHLSENIGILWKASWTTYNRLGEGHTLPVMVAAYVEYQKVSLHEEELMEFCNYFQEFVLSTYLSKQCLIKTSSVIKFVIQDHVSQSYCDYFQIPFL